MDKGGGKTLIHKMWIISRFFFNPSLSDIGDTMICPVHKFGHIEKFKKRRIDTDTNLLSDIGDTMSTSTTWSCRQI